MASTKKNSQRTNGDFKLGENRLYDKISEILTLRLSASACIILRKVNGSSLIFGTHGLNDSLLDTLHSLCSSIDPESLETDYFSHIPFDYITTLDCGKHIETKFEALCFSHTDISDSIINFSEFINSALILAEKLLRNAQVKTLDQLACHCLKNCGNFDEALLLIDDTNGQKSFISSQDDSKFSFTSENLDLEITDFSGIMGFSDAKGISGVFGSKVDCQTVFISAISSVSSCTGLWIIEGFQLDESVSLVDMTVCSLIAELCLDYRL